MSGSPSAGTRVPRSRNWRTLLWAVPAAIALAAVVVLVAKGLRELPAVQDFVSDHPGTVALPEGAPVGFPPWLSWQHFLNSLLILLIIRSGWQVRTEKRPAAYWTRRNSGLLRTTGAPKRISLTLWFHLSLDALWVVNGLVFYVLLFASGQWMRIVPTSWEFVPNAISAGLQYASLQWPTESGWANYNSLQVFAYFVTVFIAAPLAAVTGIRMSGAWPAGASRLNAVYRVEIARAVHFPVMLYFVLFTIVHVTLVATTGLLRNLNNMYAVNDGTSWLGFGIFAVSLAIMVAAWIAAKPLLLRPIASLMGTVSR